MITVKQAEEVLRINKALGEYRRTLAALDSGRAKTGKITVTITEAGATTWSDGKDFTIGGTEMGKIALGYVRRHYQLLADDCVRRLNAMGGEVQS